MNSNKPLTLQELNDLYKKTFYMEDNAVIPLVTALIVGSRLNSPPVWAYIIGPSSGGKTAMLSLFAKVPFCHQISDLTANTFLSGMSSGDRETSLLKRLGDKFTIIMKDFTTILSKSPETQEAIVAQMREIYDGHLVKTTGTGKDIEWGSKEKPAKATFIMASTEGIYKIQEKFADMGTRAINYVLLDQDRKKTCKVSLRKSSTLDAELSFMQEKMKEFVLYKVNNIPAQLPTIPEDFEDEIIEICDFASMCRSVVLRDYRGEKNLALSAEFPMRMAKQLLSAAQFLIYCNDGVLTDEFRKTVFKLGLDSIPKQRKIVLGIMAKYNRVNVLGVAQEANYKTDFVRSWIEDLNMFGITNRYQARNKEYWTLKEEYKVLLRKHLGIKEENYDLEGIDSGDTISSSDTDENWIQKEQKKQVELEWDNLKTE